MKSNEQLKGLTKEEEKTKNIFCELMNYFFENKNEDTDKLLEHGELNVKISRYDLTLLINTAFKKTVDRFTVYKYIKYLICMNFIQQNPDSHITIHGNILPDNNTRYFIDYNLIKTNWQLLIDKRNDFLEKNTHTHPITTTDSTTENIL
jgi:hypothetical protein